ncbi:hypothetical protein D3OALGA1CA_4531 [Olavius algarvensis associated proteobacterium Delta 3]|nr:hypothetical protein D3OALGA1CA_4531 [Olavius algarvensis associated proteobacterium Delta 3]
MLDTGYGAPLLRSYDPAGWMLEKDFLSQSSQSSQRKTVYSTEVSRIRSDAGCWVLDTGYWMLGTGYGAPLLRSYDPAGWILVNGSGAKVSGVGCQVSGVRILDAEVWVQGVRCNMNEFRMQDT